MIITFVPTGVAGGLIALSKIPACNILVRMHMKHLLPVWLMVESDLYQFGSCKDVHSMSLADS